MPLEKIFKKILTASTKLASLLTKTASLVLITSDNITKSGKLLEVAHLGLSEFVSLKSNKAEGMP